MSTESSSVIGSLIDQTKASKKFADKAKQVMPGGVTANIKFFEPYPIAMKKAKGAYVTDVDDNEYIDYLLGYGALMTGHGHPALQQAIQQQWKEEGTFLFGTPHAKEIEMAKKLQTLYPSMERLRYTNSGTEATLLAIRTAFAYTGKYTIAKFEGHYHGGYDQLLFSVNPPLHEAGPADEPFAVPESKGIDPHFEAKTILLPFNDLEATSAILDKHKANIAVVILEPIQGGFIPATQTFVDGLRKVTSDLGILLIFDEVKTGFRIGLGGAQQLYGVKPDISALGKVIGGGFPFGVVGGRQSIMEVSSPVQASDVFQPGQSSHAANEVLFHSGTYNGHPSILAAGLATITILEKEIDLIQQQTDKLKRGIEQLGKAAGLPIQAVGVGSIFNIVISQKATISNYRDLQTSQLQLRKELDYRLLTKGIYTKPLNRYSLSTAHGDVELNRTLEAWESILKEGQRK